jgi:hypothetical protein
MSDGSKKLQVSLNNENLTLANFNSNIHATIQHPASFIHKSLFKDGIYDETYKIIADIKFWIERIIMQNCTVEYLPYAITNFSMDGISSMSVNYTETIAERSRIFKEVLPPRILIDYEVLWQIKESPLLKYIPFLEKTTGLNKLVAKTVGSIVGLYKVIKKDKSS